MKYLKKKKNYDDETFSIYEMLKKHSKIMGIEKCKN